MDALTELKFAFARARDAGSYKVLRDYLFEHAPDGVVDTKQWVDDRCAETIVHVKTLAGLKAEARRRGNPQETSCDDYVLVRVKHDVPSGFRRGFKAGEVTLGSRVPAVAAARLLVYPCWCEANPSVQICLVAEAFEYIEGDIAEDAPPPPVPPLKVELRKFTSNERFSEETLCFRADIYVNGKRVGHCGNDGHGGSTDVEYLSEEASESARAWIDALPPTLTNWDEEGHLAAETGNPPTALTYDDDLYFSTLAQNLHDGKAQKRLDVKLKKWADADRARGLAPYVFTIRQGGAVTTAVVGVNPKFAPVEALLAKEREKFEKKYKGAQISVEVAP